MYRVLVADDEPIERIVVNRTIQKYFAGQLEVVTVGNGRTALEMYEEQPFEIVIFDIEMPGISGLEAAEQLRNRGSRCSIIFLTAFDEFNYAKKAFSVRALDYILKPFEEEELIAAIEEAVSIARKQEQGDIEEDVYSSDEKSQEENLKNNVVAEMIHRYIEEHYIEDISLQEVAGAMNYSDAYFCKIFKQCFDKSFIMYLSEYRVEKAKVLLEDVLINIKDVSARVGYRDPNYFAKVFKRTVGVTPTEYKTRAMRQLWKGDEK